MSEDSQSSTYVSVSIPSHSESNKRTSMDVISSYIPKEPLNTPDHIKQLLYVLSKKAEKQRSLHEKEATRLTKYSNSLTNATIILSTVSALGGMTAFPKCPGIYDFISYFSFNSMAACVSMIAAFQRMHRFAERAHDHNKSAISFSKFHRKLNVSLLSPHKNLDALIMLNERFNLEFDYLSEMSPQLHRH